MASIAHKRLLSVIGGCAALIFTTSEARAADDGITAEHLFVEGMRLIDNGAVDAACEKFEASRKIDPAFGTLFRLADCRERQKRLALAWSLFREAATASANRNLGVWVARCEKRAAAIEGKLGKVVVEVDGRAPKSIAVNGLVFSTAMTGTAIPVDAGSVVVEATFDDGTSATASALVEQGQSATIVVRAPEPPAEAKPAAPAAAPTPVLEDPNRGEARSSARTLGWIGLGVGAGAAAFGAIATVVAFGKRGDAETLCPSSPCASREGVQQNEAARDWARAGFVGFVAAGALAGAGVVLLVTSPRGSSTASHVDVRYAGDGARLEFIRRF